jgi:hypothetical protein
MPKNTFTQPIAQLPKQKGGYFYLVVAAKTAASFTNQHKTRLICTINKQNILRCGLNHLGNGNFFIIVATKIFKSLGIALGSNITFTLTEDPNQLGAEMPEALTILLQQDEALHAKFYALTQGKQRGIIHQIAKIKNLDIIIKNATNLINAGGIRPKNKT